MDPSDDRARMGWRDYSPLLLSIYDPMVLRVQATVIWHCPVKHLTAGYRRNIRSNHLDVGPGTGYFLEKSLPDGLPLTIVDPNENVLGHVTRRLRDVPVNAVEADVLRPLPVEGPFESAALNLVLHCLPGPPERKESAIANVAAVLARDGVLFGATVLGRSANHSWIARRVLDLFNRRGAFDNLADSETWLRSALGRSFESVEVEVIGSVAIFAARNPISPARGDSRGGVADD